MRVLLQFLDGERATIEDVSAGKVEELKTAAANGVFWTNNAWTINTKSIKEFKVLRNDEVSEEQVERESGERRSRQRLKEERGKGPQSIFNDKTKNRLRTPVSKRGKRT